MTDDKNLEGMIKELERFGVIKLENPFFQIPKIKTPYEEINNNANELVSLITAYNIFLDKFGESNEDHVNKRRPWRKEMKEKYGDLFKDYYKNKIGNNWFNAIYAVVDDINDILQIQYNLGPIEFEPDTEKFHSFNFAIVHLSRKTEIVHLMENAVMNYLINLQKYNVE